MPWPDAAFEREDGGDVGGAEEQPVERVAVEPDGGDLGQAELGEWSE